MDNRIKEAAKALSLRHFLFLLFLSFIAVKFIIFVGYEQIFAFLKFKPYGFFYDYYRNLSFILPFVFIFLGIVLLFWLYAAISLYFKKDTNTSPSYSAVVLSPIALLYLWRAAEPYSPFYIPVAIVLLTGFSFFYILSEQKRAFRRNALAGKLVIFLVAIFYIAFFSYIAAQKYYSFSFFNTKDFAIYNQTFWNTVHGRVFQNSMYGSNFACHNSPFFFLLVPFYYIIPHPLTLIFLRIFLLCLAVIPFYLIAKDTLQESSAVPMTLAFIFFPFIASLNIIAPHEITYAPFFILFAYYFFSKKKFVLFLLFLVLTLSIKEHLSLVAIMFGILAQFQRKGAKWVYAPILLGIFWAVFSLWLILYFQSLYSSHTDAAWLMVNLKKRLLISNGNVLSSLVAFIFSSNLTSLYSIQWIVTLFLFLGVIPPLLSLTSLLGLPEFLISLLSNNLAMFTIPWHYNVAVSCFLLIGTLEGIKKISRWKWFKTKKISPRAAVSLLSFLILSLALINSYLWLEFTQSLKDEKYIKAVEKAISVVPRDAFLTVPRNIAVQISNRQNYSILDSARFGDYILLDEYNTDYLSREKIAGDYRQVFYGDGVRILKKNKN
jgi:uncharacterized membrane protein